MEGMKVNEQITVAGQITPEQLDEAARQGFKSVLNLRAADEEGFMADERHRAEAAGLRYKNIPVKKEEISDELTTRVLKEIDELPKPVLVHCASGMRAGAMAFMHMATREGMSAEKAMSRAQESGFDCNSEPQLKQFFQHYVETHSHE
ncbi:MAG: protein tyrosine phosphatase family protein [Acidobacteriota bacterium]|nr:protein tyrosine phosphatase family protein [Acidobacteriota bacterium]